MNSVVMANLSRKLGASGPLGVKPQEANMVVMRPRRDSRSEDLVDEDGQTMWQGVKLGEFWKTDMQLAIRESNLRHRIAFTTRMGKAGTAEPYQQAIPLDFAREHPNLYNGSITLEGPTGKTWTTVIRPLPYVVRFGKGWRQFSEDNRLQEGHQLLFTLVGRSHFLVEFFDRFCRRCTGYPPRLANPPDETLPDGAETLLPESDFQELVDGGPASRRHGEATQSAGAVPWMGTAPTSVGALDSDLPNLGLRQHGRLTPARVTDQEPSLPHEHVREQEKRARIGIPTMADLKTEHRDTDAIEEAMKYICLDSDDSDDSDNTPLHLLKPKPERNYTGNLNDLDPGKPTQFHPLANESRAPQIQEPPSLSSDEDSPELRKKPVSRRKGVVKRPPPAPSTASLHEAGAASGSGRAMRLLQQQGCMRFSDLVLKSERLQVSDVERRLMAEAANRFALATKTENFLMVLRTDQVYYGFHLVREITLNPGSQ